MEHGAFVSSASFHAKALHMNSESRVMQFAAYTYDVSMGEILTTMMQCGCVCVPSEEERMGNLAAAINSLKANWIFFTPTVAGFLKPSTVPLLETLVLGGEHATEENIKTWSGHVHLINSYGTCLALFPKFHDTKSKTYRLTSYSMLTLSRTCRMCNMVCLCTWFELRR